MPTSNPWLHPVALAAILCLAALSLGCDHAAHDAPAPPSEGAALSPAAVPTALPSPAGAAASAPELTASRHGVLLSWLEPAAGGGEVLELRTARLGADGWSAATTVTAGDDFFANWADRPSVVAAADGLYAHWLRKLGPGTYAYGIELARSTDAGAAWTQLGLLHEDRSESEHGFATLVPQPGGGVRAVYLDGRATPAGEAMQLRAATVDGAGAAESQLLDAAVCDCCATDATAAEGALVAVYRDRSAGEIRDVAVVRDAGAGWSEPRVVAPDGWRIPGCPVNGPAIAADGQRVAVAWFTAAEERPRVRIAFSIDGGASFGPALAVDEARPLGRVDVVAGDDGSAVVSWLGTTADGAVVRLGRFTAAGAAGPALDLGATGASRAAGVPRMVRDGERLVVAWLDGSGLRTATLPLAAL